MTPPYPAFDGSQVCAQTDPEAFFPEHRGSSPKPAKKLCAGCPFLDACREYAIWHSVEGVWGGTTYKERFRIRADRGIKVVAADAPLRDLILAASPHMLASVLADQLGCNEKTVTRHRQAAALIGEAA